MIAHVSLPDNAPFHSPVVVKYKFLHKFFPMVKTTTREKVGKVLKTVAAFYVNQK